MQQDEVKSLTCSRCKQPIPRDDGTNLAGAVLRHYWAEHPEVLVNVDREQIRMAANAAELTES